jgi:hypothetical protein
MLHMHLHHATSLLAVFAQDPDYNTQAKAMGGMLAGFMGLIALFSLAMYAFLAFVFWRIFVKAGMSGALGLIALFPGLGFLVCVCILAFAEWNVVPAPTASPYLPPTYPPPPPPAFQPPPQV